MKGGRKNLKRAVEEEAFTLQQGHSIMQVVFPSGSNLIKVMDTKGEKLLALFPAKFQKSIWMKRGSFVVVDESEKEEAIEKGRKVSCVVSQILFHEQVCALQKSLKWPEVFKSSSQGNSNECSQSHTKLCEEDELNSSDNDGLTPLEVNMNRRKPVELQSDKDP